MTRDQIVTAIQTAPKGANVIVEWDRLAKVRKTCGHTIRKIVRAVGRVGIDYDKIAAVQAKRESGELPAQNAGLPDWLEWVIKPFLLRHKTKGTEYLRLYFGTSRTYRPAVRWLMDGETVSYEDVEQWLLASEKGEKTGDCFMVKVADVTRLHTEEVEDRERADVPEVTEEVDQTRRPVEVEPVDESVEAMEDDEPVPAAEAEEDEPPLLSREEVEAMFLN